MLRAATECKRRGPGSDHAAMWDRRPDLCLAWVGCTSGACNWGRLWL